MICLLKINKVQLNEEVGERVCKQLQERVEVKNVAQYYSVANYFKLKCFSKLTFCYIERCFTSVVETNGFLELRLNLLKRVLSSDQLDISSEIEVFNIADAWINYNYKERSKFAKDLLLKVRLPLMSESVLDSLMVKDSAFNKDNECVAIIKGLLQNSFTERLHSYGTYHTSRYCNQKMYDIVISCGYDKTTLPYMLGKDVRLIDGECFGSVKSVALPKHNRYYAQTVYLKGDIYMFDSFDRHTDYALPIEKYSSATNSWVEVGGMCDKRNFYCVAAFMGNILVFGGRNDDYKTLDSCVEFDPKRTAWTELATMHDARTFAACAVFEGRVVTSGGSRYLGDSEHLKSVEAYDHAAKRWSFMPDMIECRIYHSLVAVRNKLFAVGGYKSTCCEVFDSACKVFVQLKTHPEFFKLYTSKIKCASIGSRIVVFGEGAPTISCYDVGKDEWSEQASGATCNLWSFSCTAIPKLECCSESIVER